MNFKDFVIMNTLIYAISTLPWLKWVLNYIFYQRLSERWLATSEIHTSLRVHQNYMKLIQFVPSDMKGNVYLNWIPSLNCHSAGPRLEWIHQREILKYILNPNCWMHFSGQLGECPCDTWPWLFRLKYHTLYQHATELNSALIYIPGQVRITSIWFYPNDCYQ